MKCGAKVDVQCEHCGSEILKECGEEAAVGVFYGEPGDDPCGFCSEHFSDRDVGSGWVNARIPVGDLRKKKGKWQVRAEGKWHDEDSEEYCNIVAKKYGFHAQTVHI